MGVMDAIFGTQEAAEDRSLSLSITDPALAEYLGITSTGIRGVAVSESSSLGVSAFFRCVSLISSTIAGLPLKSYELLPNDARVRVGTWVDDPAGPHAMTPFTWKQMTVAHLVVYGTAYLLHIYNAAGALVGAWPIHPTAVTVKWSGFDKVFEVRFTDGTRRIYSTAEMTQVLGLTLDGIHGVSPLTYFRTGIALGIANEQAAGRTIGSGMTIAGLVTPEEDLEEEEATTIKAGLQAKLTGVENAGDIAVINRKLKFTPWAMTNEDAQFMESRAFQVEEFARWFGVPPHLLAQTEKQTSWGTGVAEQNLGLSRYTLMSWTTPLQEALTTLLPVGEWAEFDYAGLMAGTPAQEIELLIKQVDAGLLTVDEARAIRNLPPLPKAVQAPAEEPV